MPQIYVTDRHGNEQQIEAKIGWKIMEIIRDAGLPIEAACGGVCACATCHVYVDPSWQSKLPAPEDIEEDMLDLAMEPNESSRLSCQVVMSEALDGLKVTLAPD